MRIATSKNPRGFTIVEVLAVISILGVLASIIFASLRNARDTSNAAAVAANVRNYELALHTYYNDTGTLPINGGGNKVCISPIGEDCLAGSVTYQPDAAFNAIIQQYNAIAPGPTAVAGPLVTKQMRGVMYMCMDPSSPPDCPTAVIMYAIKGDTCILKNATTTGPTTGGIICNVPLP